MGIVKKIINKYLRINSSRVHLETFLKTASKDLADGALMLDAGSGDQRYKIFFPKTKYESADICKLERDYGDVSYVCDLKSIPVEDSRFDAIICTQVLEHVNEPIEVLNEFRRVLKVNGTLYLTAPLYYPEHEIPYDFFRYTQFGHQYIFDKCGFEIDKIEWMEGYYMTLSTQLWVAFDSLSFNYKNYGIGLLGIFMLPLILFLKIFFPFIGYIFARLDIKHKYTSHGHCKNYQVIAKKKT